MSKTSLLRELSPEQAAKLVALVAKAARDNGVQMVQLGELVLSMAIVPPDVTNDKGEVDDEQYTATGTRPVNLAELADKLLVGKDV